MAQTQDLLLRFTPHIPRRQHAAGWTPDRQIAFIAALARCGVVSHAARSVGMSPRSAYMLRSTVRRLYSNWADVPMTPQRAKSLGPGYIYSFAAAWDHALGQGLELQIDATTPVALEGEEVPIISRGRIIGWQRKFNARLAIAALGAFRRYTEGQSFDHDARIARETHKFAGKVERLFRDGPIHWPEPETYEDFEERRARLRHERKQERIYGKPIHDLLDAYGPADQPPRTLAERGECPIRERALVRRYGPRHGGMFDPFGPADQPPRPLIAQGRTRVPEQ